MKDLLETIALLILLPFVILYRLFIFLVLTAWLWAIPLAILVWAFS